MSSSPKTKKRSPTAMNKWGRKIQCSDGYTFDSEKEHDFYHRFVKHSGYEFEIHPHFKLAPLIEINGGKITSIVYTPDFIVKDQHGNWLHVIDVKNSFGQYGIDQVNKLRFRLFAAKFGHPVEAVVIRAHDFKVITQGVTKPLKETEPFITAGFDYTWRDATNY